MLELADPHDDWQAFENAVRSTCFKGHDTSDYNRCKLANSTRFGMIAYGIVARDAKLTDPRRKLIAMNDDQPIHYQRLAKHILLNLHRSTVVSCARGIAAAGKLSHSTPCATDWRHAGCITRRWRTSEHGAPLACQGGRIVGTRR